MLQNINQILFPTDFSSVSEKALPFALEIARSVNARLTIMHSIEEPYNVAPLVREVKHQMVQKVEDLLEDMLREISREEKYKNLDIDTTIESGRTVYAIIEEARQSNADLVVMGTKGAGGLKQLLFGSNTSDLVLVSAVPVFAVPENCDFKGINNILFTTDYHDGDLAVLKGVVNFADRFNASVTVLHTAEDMDLREDISFRGFRELVRGSITYENFDFELIIEDDFTAGVNNYLDRHEVSLITMTRYKKTFFHSLLEKDHSREMSAYTNVPLLVIPGKKNP